MQDRKYAGNKKTGRSVKSDTLPVDNTIAWCKWHINAPHSADERDTVYDITKIKEVSDRKPHPQNIGQEEAGQLTPSKSISQNTVEINIA